MRNAHSQSNIVRPPALGASLAGVGLFPGREFLRMVFRIHEDVVERKLDLIGRRTYLQAAVQLALALVIAWFVVVVLVSVVSKMIGNLPANWITRFDCWWRLILAASIICVPATLIGAAFLRLVLTVSDGCRRMTWDARSGELTAVFYGGLLGLRRSENLPLAEIQRIDLHAAPGGNRLALKLTVHSARQLARKPLVAELRVQHVDRREEAMDLLFRIARQCGIEHYAVEGSDVRNLQLRAARKPQKSSDRYQPIPEVSSAVRYEEDVVSPGAVAPAIKVVEFSPSVFSSCVTGTLLKQWQPGERVHFHEPAADAAMHGVAGLIAAIGAGFISYYLAPTFAAWLPGWAVMTLAILAAPLISSTVVFFAYREREIVFDWPTGTIAWRTGRRWRHAQLKQIERLLLRGEKRTVSRKKGRSYTKHWCRLEIVVEGRQVFLVQTNEYREDPDTPANRLGSLAAALSESLGVGWQWREYGAWR